MLKKKLGILCSAAIALAMALAPSASFAGEPTNNTKPWYVGSTAYNGDASVYTSMQDNVAWGVNESMTAGDVDYLVVSCGNVGAGYVGNVKSVRVSFTHAQGDIDMKVYRLDGTLIGQSTSTANLEILDVSAQKAGAVVVMVYGYLGAANAGGYSVTQVCK